MDARKGRTTSNKYTPPRERDEIENLYLNAQLNINLCLHI